MNWVRTRVIRACYVLALLGFFIAPFTQMPKASAERLAGDFIDVQFYGSDNAKYNSALATDSAGNVYETGYLVGTVDLDSSSGIDLKTGANQLYVTKHNADGSYAWTRIITEGGRVQAQSLAVDSLGNMYVGGVFTTQVDFNPDGAGDVKNSVNSNWDDLFLTKYNADGSYGWTKSWGNTNTEAMYSMAVDSDDNVYIAGTFGGTLDLNPDAGTDTFIANGGYDIFLTKFNADGSYGWTKAFGGSNWDYAFKVYIDGSDNIYVGGRFVGSVEFNPGGTAAIRNGGSGSGNAFITKYNSAGTHQWVRSFGNTSTEQTYDIGVDGSGNVFIGGYFGGTVNFNPDGTADNKTSAGSNDAFLVKYTGTGTYQWSKTYGSTGAEYVFSLVLDENNNIYVSGSYENTVNFNPGGSAVNRTSNGQSDIYITRYNADASHAWTVAYGSSAFDQTEQDILYSQSSGKIIVSGNFSGTINFNPNGSAQNRSSNGSTQYLLAYNTNGTFQSYLAPEQIKSGVVYRPGGAFDSANNKITLGNFSGLVDIDPSDVEDIRNSNDTAAYDYFIQKASSTGKVQWTKTVETSVWSARVVIDSKDNIYHIGTFYGTVNFNPSGIADNKTSAGGNDVFITKFNANGNYEWTKTIGGISTEYVFGADTDSTDNIVLGGYFADTADFDPGTGTQNRNIAGVFDGYILKLNADGNYVSVKTFGSTSTEYVSGLAVDSSDNIVISGTYAGTVDFNPGGTAFNRTSTGGGGDAYVAKYNSSLNALWVRTYGGVNFENAEFVQVDEAGNVYHTGTFNDSTIDFNPGGTADLHTAQGTNREDTYITKYNADGSYGWTRRIGGLDDEYPDALLVSSQGIVTLAGYAYNYEHNAQTADYYPTGPGGDVTILGQNAFLVSLTTSGSLADARTIRNERETYNYIDHAMLDKNDMLYLYGETQSDESYLDFIPSSTAGRRTHYGEVGYEAKFQIGYFQHITGLPGGVKIVNANNESYDASDLINGGIPRSASALLRIKSNTTNAVIADIGADMIVDRGWSSSLVAASDIAAGKSVVHNLTNQSAAAGTFTLYIPRLSGHSAARICPNATSLTAVDNSCTGGYTVSLGDNNVTAVTLGNQNYLAVSGLSGTGGMSVAGGLAATGMNMLHIVGLTIGLIGIAIITVRKSHKAS